DVYKRQPASRAGLMRGDIIVRYNGKKIKDVATLRNMVAQTKIGTEVELIILRKSKEYSVRIKVVEVPPDSADYTPSSSKGSDANENALSGVTVIDITQSVAKQLGLSPDEKGVVVMKIEPGSIADISGLKEGDLIQEIDRQKVNNLNDFNKIVSRLKGSEQLLLFINRSGKKFYLALPS
ncbi:MAG: PDZ domain-containing protein, partial [Thermodesulfovibrionales bacterium]|nr:PDZ domain-containing protein [Thermodesulfovibrionales bacterium]